MILIVRPNYDPTTRYLYSWSEQLIKEAERKSISVIDLAGEKANRKEFEGRLKKTNTPMVLLNGHGNHDLVTGHDHEILVRASENTELLAGKITYAVSCDSAITLGKEVGSFVKTAYIGFSEEFTFAYSQKHLNHPVNDPMAQPFMEFSNQISLSLMKGHTVGESVNRAKELAISRIHKLLTSASDPDAQASARYLWWDVNHLVCHGEETKRLTHH